MNFVKTLNNINTEQNLWNTGLSDARCYINHPNTLTGRRLHRNQASWYSQDPRCIHIKNSPAQILYIELLTYLLHVSTTQRCTDTSYLRKSMIQHTPITHENKYILLNKITVIDNLTRDNLTMRKWIFSRSVPKFECKVHLVLISDLWARIYRCISNRIFQK